MTASSSQPQLSLPPTKNTSPLAPKVGVWYDELTAVHNKYCETVGSCCGLRSLPLILQNSVQTLPAQENQCSQAVEAELLIHGVYYGFPLLPVGIFPADVPPFDVDNYPSSELSVAAITATITNELEGGLLRIVEDKPRWITPLYGKEEYNQDGTLDKVRIITDCSVPLGHSINDAVDVAPFTMLSHEDAYALLTPRAYMAKLDIASAFRTVGVRPDHWCLLGIKWRIKGTVCYILNTRLPFGLSNSPEIFCRLTAAVRAMMAAAGFTATFVYVDDFFVVEGTKEACTAAQEALSLLLPALGFTEKLSKRWGASQECILLGLHYATNSDSNGKMTVTVPEDKMRKAELLAARCARQTSLTVRELQSAVGYFNHLASAVWTAKAFLGRLLDALRTAQQKGLKRIPVTRAMQLDLRFWQRFARQFNGEAVILQEPIMLRGFFATDASDKGMGGFLNGLTFSVPWDSLRNAGRLIPLECRPYNKAKLWPSKDNAATWDIMYRELFAHWWAILMWTPDHLQHKTSVLHGDNAVARYDLNKMRSPNVVMMCLIRHICSFCAVHNARIRVHEISSGENVLADALSRLDMVTYERAYQEWNDNVATTSLGGSVKMYQPRVFLQPWSDDSQGGEDLARSPARAPVRTFLATVRLYFPQGMLQTGEILRNQQSVVRRSDSFYLCFKAGPFGWETSHIWDVCENSLDYRRAYGIDWSRAFAGPVRPAWLLKRQR